MGAEDLDIAHDHHEQAGEQQAPDDGPRHVLERVLRLAAQRRRALEADEAEDARDDRERHPVEADALELDLRRVDVEAVREQHDPGKAEDADDRDRLKDERDVGGEPDVLVGDIPAQRRAYREEDDRLYYAVVPEGVKELLEEDGEPVRPAVPMNR